MTQDDLAILPEVLAWYEAEKKSREVRADFDAWHRANPQREAGDFLRKEPKYQRQMKARIDANDLLNPMFDAIAATLKDRP